MIMSGILRVYEVLIQSDSTLGTSRKFIPPTWYRGGGGRGWNPSGEFLICYSISICLLGFYQELEIRLKPQEMVIFVLDMKT